MWHESAVNNVDAAVAAWCKAWLMSILSLMIFVQNHRNSATDSIMPAIRWAIVWYVSLFREKLSEARVFLEFVFIKFYVNLFNA